MWLFQNLNNKATVRKAEEFLRRFEYVEKAKSEYISDGFFSEGVIFEAIGRYMAQRDGEKPIIGFNTQI